jgi:hypothetical protein
MLHFETTVQLLVVPARAASVTVFSGAEVISSSTQLARLQEASPLSQVHAHAATSSAPAAAISGVCYSALHTS